MIPKTMRAVVYRSPGVLQVETVPVPALGPHELLVKVAVCGVCPTDVKKIQFGTVAPPRIFGHETSGTIVRLGVRVRDFKLGERVALHHHVPCLKCHACRHHAYAQCPQYKVTGITAGFEPAGGGYAEYVRVMPFVLPGVVRIPARNSFIEGAMLEPVNTVLKAVQRLNVLPGDAVLVVGQGPIGLMFTKLLALRGIKVLATDLRLVRLRFARKWGAQSTVRAWRGSSQPGPDVSRKSKLKGNLPAMPTTPLLRAAQHLTSGRGLDAAILAVSSDAALREAQFCVRGAGQVLLFSHTRRGDESSLDLATICMDEKDLLGSYSADVHLQNEVSRLVFGRKLDVRQLVTHQFPLEKTADAVDLAANPTPESLKIVVNQEP